MRFDRTVRLVVLALLATRVAAAAGHLWHEHGDHSASEHHQHPETPHPDCPVCHAIHLEVPSDEPDVCALPPETQVPGIVWVRTRKPHGIETPRDGRPRGPPLV